MVRRRVCPSEHIDVLVQFLNVRTEVVELFRELFLVVLTGRVERQSHMAVLALVEELHDVVERKRLISDISVFENNVVV